MKRIEFAEQTIRSIRNELIRKDIDDLNINIKTSHTDIVTKYDQKVETLLCNAIKEQFSHDVFVTEEGTQSETGTHMWIIDPIDGTANFVVQKYGYAISVAYYEDFQEVFGLVYDVARDIMYKGIKNQGSYVNDIPLVPLGNDYNFSEELLDVSYPAIKNFKHDYNIDFAKIDGLFLAHRACGSAALAICAIAAQTLSVYASFKLSIWDYAAAKIVLEAVGGACCNIDTVGFPIDDTQRPYLAAKNKTMLDEVLEKLK